MSGTTSTAQTIQQYYQNILQRTGSVNEVQAWTTLVTNGGLPLSTVENDFVTSTEAQTYVAPIVQLYEADLGRAPDAAGLKAWVQLAESGTSIAAIDADIQASPEGQAYVGGTTFTTATATAFVTKLYTNILNRTPDTAGLNAWVSALTGGTLTAKQVEDGIRLSAEGQKDLSTATNNYLLQVGAGGTVSGNIYTATGAPGTTFTLTTGPDNITLTGNNNTINGTSIGNTASGTGITYSTGDTISAASGSTGNVLNLADGGTGFQWSPLSLPGVSVSGVQTVNLTSAEAVSANTTSSVDGFSGVTALNVRDSSNGGPNNTIITAGSTVAVTLTDVNSNGQQDIVNGGSTVSVTTTNTGASAGITVGTVGTASTAPTGAITATENTTAVGPIGGGPISTFGGTTVTITENLTNTDPTGLLINALIAGAVSVTGTSTTTSVTVNETAAVTAVLPGVGTPAVAGITDGPVLITDVNSGTPTKAGTITTVSLNNFGLATINDNAMTSLSLSGTGGSVAINNAAGTATATTLALAVSGLTDAGVLSDNSQITTLNITTGGTVASSLGGVTDAALTTLAVSGTQQLIISGATGSTALSSVTVSGGAGLGITLGTGATFTSTSTGTDVVTISAAATKTITGNGTANEEIVWNGAASPTTLGSSVTGFKVLGVGSAVVSETFDMNKLTGFTGLDVQANANGGTIQLINVAAGTPLAIDGTVTGTLLYQTADSTGATDSAAVTIGKSANKAGFIVNALTMTDSLGTGIGSLSITSNASTKAVANIITALNDNALSSLTVAGTGGLSVAGPLADNAASLTISGSSSGTAGIALAGIVDTKLTTLSLSGTNNINLGVVGDGTSGITVSGSSFNSNATLTLTGNTTKGSTDSVTLGNGNDIVTDSGAAASGAAVNITVGNGTNVVTDTTALAGSTVSITAGTGANTIVVGGVATNNVTFGAHSAATADVTTTGAYAGATGPGTVPVQAIIAGLNASGADTITFAGDAGATGPVQTFTATQLSTSNGGTTPTLTQAVNAILGGTGGLTALAQHQVGEFQLGGNTYFLEQAGTTGNAFAAGDTLVQLTGSYTFATNSTTNLTTSTAATAGVLKLLG